MTALTERQMQFRIGMLVLVCILLFMGFVLSVGQRSALFEKHYSLWASFSSSEGLADGAPVRLAGVTVGNVTGIAFGRDPKDRRINVTFTVERRVQNRIRADSIASIGTIGLVGDKVLDLTVGSDDKPVLTPGSQVASMDSPDYARLLQKGDQILDHVTRITASLDEFLAGGEQVGKRNLADALRSVRATLVEVEKGQGLLHELVYGKNGGELLAHLNTTAQSLEQLAQAANRGPGLLHALLYRPAEETLGPLHRATENLNRAVERADAVLREAQTGPGLLHALIYDPEGGQILERLSRTSAEMEALVRAAREGRGLVPALFFDPERLKLLDEAQAAATNLRALTEDLRDIVEQLKRGQGTIGGLLEDPTVYEDLSSLLRGANRSFLLRSLIRSTREDGAQPGK
ncbi:MAG TPA: MlaD family protein [Candidatus Baltobacteraceae bacterium]|nr:MlaD family protein [Candidatus Baltobacteraceae bacterium]